MYDFCKWKQLTRKKKKATKRLDLDASRNNKEADQTSNLQGEEECHSKT